jgi:hypothetical protein
MKELLTMGFFLGFMAFWSFIMYRKGAKDAVGICFDCCEQIETDHLCHDCRAKSWGEQGQ